MAHYVKARRHPQNRKYIIREARASPAITRWMCTLLAPSSEWDETSSKEFLLALRCASAVFADVASMSVCPCVTSRYWLFITVTVQLTSTKLVIVEVWWSHARLSSVVHHHLHVCDTEHRMLAVRQLSLLQRTKTEMTYSDLMLKLLLRLAHDRFALFVQQHFRASRGSLGDSWASRLLYNCLLTYLY